MQYDPYYYEDLREFQLYAWVHRSVRYYENNLHLQPFDIFWDAVRLRNAYTRNPLFERVYRTRWLHPTGFWRDPWMDAAWAMYDYGWRVITEGNVFIFIITDYNVTTRDAAMGLLPTVCHSGAA